MPDLPVLTAVKVDTSGLDAALSMAREWNRRTPAESCNIAQYSILNDVMRRIPKVTADRISSEMAITVPIVSKSKSGKARAANVPMAVAVVIARAKSTSRYNQLTNNRYALAQNPFKGKSRDEGRAAMVQAVAKMIAARRKSGAFLKSGFANAKAVFKDIVKGGFKITDATPDLFFNRNNDFGTGTPAREGSEKVSSESTDLLGSKGLNASNIDKANMSIVVPLVQDAINTEGLKAIDYYLKHAAEKLRVDWNKAQK